MGISISFTPDLREFGGVYYKTVLESLKDPRSMINEHQVRRIALVYGPSSNIVDREISEALRVRRASLVH